MLRLPPITMGRYAAEPDNATKSAKARGSNLRVSFKVIGAELRVRRPGKIQWRRKPRPPRSRGDMIQIH